MICNSDGTYTIEQSDIDKVNKWIYKLLNTRATSGSRTFNLNAFVKYIYDTSLAATGDIQKSLTIARQVPMSMDIATRADSTLRKGLSELQGYSTDEILNLKDSFIESIKAVSDLVSKDQSKTSLASSLKATADAALAQPKDNSILAPSLNADTDVNNNVVSDLPYTVLSTTGNENIPGREWYYGFIKNLSEFAESAGGLRSNGTASYLDIRDGIRMAMVLGSQIPVEQLYLDVQNQPEIEAIKQNQMFTVVTDNTGEFVYFDDNYKISDAENGRLVYFPTRTIPSYTKTGDTKVFKVSEQTDRSVQSIEDQVRRILKESPSLTEKSARDQVESQYQSSYSLLSDAIEYLKDNPSQKVLLNFSRINKGTLRFNRDVITKLSDIKNLGALAINVRTVKAATNEGEEDIKRRYLSIKGVSSTIPLSMSEFSLEDATKVANLLVNNVYTKDGILLSVRDKYNIIKPFVRLATNGIIMDSENNQVMLNKEAVDLENKDRAIASIIDHLRRSVTVEDIAKNETTIANQYFLDVNTYEESNGVINKFSLSLSPDGSYVINNNLIDYKEWIKDNAYVMIELDPNGEVTQVNGYFEFTVGPEARQLISTKKPSFAPIPKDTKRSVLDNLTISTVDDKAAALAKVQELINKQKNKGNNTNNTAFSMRHDSLTATKAQNKKGQKWFETTQVAFKDDKGNTVTKKLSEVIPYETLFNVVNGKGEIRATWTRNGITLYNGSDYTDLYHEAWHGFTQLFLTADQKTALYNEVKSLNETIRYYDHKAASWKTMKSGDLDFNNRNHIIYAEEYLAEKFRTYAINKSAPSARVKSLFKRIWEALKALFSRTTKESATNPYDNDIINTAFNQLYVGNLVDYTFDQTNSMFDQLNSGITAIDPKDGDTISIDTDDSLALVEGINGYVSEFIELAVTGNFYGDANPAYASKIITDPEYKAHALVYAKSQLESQHAKLVERFDLAKPGFDKNEIAKRIAIFEFAINEFGDLDNLKNNTKGTIAYFNSKTGFLDLSVSKTEDQSDKDEEGNPLEASPLYSGNGTELSGMERLDALLTFAFGNIIKREKVTDQNKKGISLNKLGLYATANVSEIRNALSTIVENVNDRAEMYTKIDAKSKEVDANGDLKPMSLMLQEFLSKVGNPAEITSAEGQSFWVKVYGALRTDRLNTLQVNVNKTDDRGGFNVVSGQTDGSFQKIQKVWKDRFVSPDNASEFFLKNKDNVSYLDLKKLADKYLIKKLADKYLKINVADINVVELLKDFGVSLTGTPKAIAEFKEKDFSGFYTYRIAPILRNPNLEITSFNQLFLENINLPNDIKISGQARVINKLSQIESEGNPAYADYMRSFAGNLISEHSSPSGPGNTLIALNNAKNFNDVIVRPELSQYSPTKNSYVKSSVIFSKMFNKDGNRNSEFKLNYEAVLGMQMLDKSNAGIDKLINSIASSQSDEQVAYLRDFFLYNLHGKGEAFKHADKNMAYIISLVGKSNYYVDPKLFADGADVNNGGRKAANKIIMGYIGSELERIKKVIASEKGELIDGEKASDIILYTTKDLDKTDDPSAIKYVTLADVGTEFTVFDDILTSDLKKELIANESIQTVEDFLKATASDKALFEKIEFQLNNYFGKLATEDRGKLESYEIFGTPSSKSKAMQTIKDRHFPKDKKMTVDEAFDSALLHFTYASFIHKHEMSTLFYGDPVMYNHDKDEHMKRIPTFFATGRIPVADMSFENWLQNNAGGYYDSQFFKKSGLTQPASNQLVSKVLNTAILEDAIESIGEVAYNQMVDAYLRTYPEASEKEAKAKYKNYLDMKSADGQGWITFDAYRALELRLDNWSATKEDMYNRILNGENIDPDTINVFFPIKKMQYAGPIGSKNFAINAVHKYSLMPLIPSIIKDTELELLHNKMVSQNIAYSVMHSGSKVANLGNKKKLDKFYTKPNSNNDVAFANNDYKFTANPIYLEYFKEQITTNDTAKKKVKMPTQKRGLITSGLYDSGIPSDFETNKTIDERRASWNALSSEKERVKQSNNYALIKKYRTSISALFDVAKTKLKMELGYKDPNSTGKQEQLKIDKLITYVKEQLTNRDTLNEYQLDFLDIGPSGELIYPQDLGSDPEQVEKLISSLVNKQIVDQISKGESFIQASSVGFRKTNLSTDRNLLFYRIGPDGKTLPMQVKIPLIGDFSKLLKHVDNDGKVIGTIDRLNELIKDEKWLSTGNNRKMITMSGDRIPIQGHNSMEVMEIAEFLDPSGGNMMVLPLEIVAKTGGDFDIDKLICLIPVIKNNMGTVELSKPAKTRKLLSTLVKEKGKLQEELKALRVKYIKGELSPEFKAEIRKLEEEQSQAQEAFDQNYINDYYVGGSLDKYMDRISNTQTSIDNLYDQLFEEKREVFQGKFDQYINEADSIVSKIREINRQQDSYKPEAYQNDFMESMDDIILRGDNFTNLTLPNDTDIYVGDDGPVNEFTSVNRPYKRSNTKTGSTKTKMSPTRIMENGYNNQKAFAMAAGKTGVSIAAKTNKIFAQYKEIGLYMEPSYVAVHTSRATGKKKEFIINQRLLVDHQMMQVGSGKAISLSSSKDVNGKDISQQINQLMNGYLDVAKEDWVFDIQAVKELEPEFLLLIQAGAGPMMATAMLSQPLIKLYVEEIRKGNNLFSAITKENPDTMQFAKYEALLNILDAYVPNLFSYKTAETYQDKQTGEIKIKKPASLALLAGAQNLLGSPENFKLEDLKRSAKKTTEIDQYDVNVFLHFIEIMNLTKGDNELKNSIDIDTKKSSGAAEIVQRVETYKNLKGQFPVSKAKELLDETYLSNFKIDDIMLAAIGAVLPLRAIPDVNKYIYNVIEKKNFENKETRENYLKHYVNDLIAYARDNYKTKVSKSDTSYKGVELSSEVDIQNQALLQLGALVKDGVLLVDQTQIDLDFSTSAYSKKGYGRGKLALFPNTIFAGYTKKNQNNLYRAFVYEREIARALYPYADTETNGEFKLFKGMRLNVDNRLSDPDIYEEFLRNKALYNSGIDNAMFISYPQMGMFSMFDTLKYIIDKNPRLSNDYTVLQNLEKIPGKENRSFVGLPRRIKDVDIQTGFTSNILSLMNTNVAKVSDEVMNDGISAFFAKFPNMAFAQAGNNSRSGLYIGSIVDTKSVATAQADNLKDFISKLSGQAAPVILDDFTKKFDMKAGYLYGNKNAYVNYNSDLDTEGLFTQETVSTDTAAILFGGGVSKIGFDISRVSPNTKDPKKAKIATDIIEFGRDTATRKSSTKKYGEAAVAQGIPRNSGNYNSNTVAFTSTSGNNVATTEDIDNTVNEILKVLNAGGSIIMDNKYNRNSNWNKSGEGKVWEQFTKQIDGSKLENISKDSDFVQVRLTTQPSTSVEKGVEVVSDNYTPELLRANSNKLFLFGDNNNRTGTGGQAIIRNEPNAMGISTKLLPKNTPEAFMSDNQLADNKAVIDSDIKKAKEKAGKEGKIIVLPIGGFGTGLAALATKAPQTFAYLNKRLQEEFGFNNTTGELTTTQSSTSVKPGVEISSNAKGLAAALTNPTELAKSKGNLTQSYPVYYQWLNKNGEAEDNEFKDLEKAYQELKDSSESKTKPSKENSGNYRLMVDLIKAKLQQHPRLVTAISDQGGSQWILSSTHQPTKQNSVWETGGQNWFIEALNDAYLLIAPEVIKPGSEAPVVKPTAQGTPGFIIDMRGPKELVNYEDGGLIPVAKVYKQTRFILTDKNGVETKYDLSQSGAQEIMDANPDNLFVFDWFRPNVDGKENPSARNFTRQAWRVGLGTGQSFGFTTRTFKGVTPTDDLFERVKEIIDEQVEQLVQIRDTGKIITFPSEGIGQNFKKEGADQIFVYLSKKLLENFGYRNPVFDKVTLAMGPMEQTGMDYTQDFYKKMADSETGQLAQTITDAEAIEHIKKCKNIE